MDSELVLYIKSLLLPDIIYYFRHPYIIIDQSKGLLIMLVGLGVTKFAVFNPDYSEATEALRDSVTLHVVVVKNTTQSRLRYVMNIVISQYGLETHNLQAQVQQTPITATILYSRPMPTISQTQTLHSIPPPNQYSSTFSF
jgi:hypothetical protein